MISLYIMLDRDGVINYDSDGFIKSPEEWIPIPGSLESIALLNANGYNVVVISNQSGLARGLFDEAILKEIHQKMQREVAKKGGRIEAIYYCPHGPGDDCSCRKPKPGLLQQFARDYRIELKAMPFIGDSLRDMQAAQAVSASPMLVKTGKGNQTLVANPKINVPVFENLYDATQFIITNK